MHENTEVALFPGNALKSVLCREAVPLSGGLSSEVPLYTNPGVKR